LLTPLLSAAQIQFSCLRRVEGLRGEDPVGAATEADRLPRDPFGGTSLPRLAPRHEPVGTGWTACVQAELNSVIGKPLGTQTYRVTITGDRIVDRRRAEEEDTCATESYEPI